MPPVPSTITTWIGIVVLLLLWQTLSGLIVDKMKKVFRNQDNYNRRKSDDPNWFEKFITHHDSLVKEIHEFTIKMGELSSLQTETLKVLREQVLQNKILHEKIDKIKHGN